MIYVDGSIHTSFRVLEVLGLQDFDVSGSMVGFVQSIDKWLQAESLHLRLVAFELFQQIRVFSLRHIDDQIAQLPDLLLHSSTSNDTAAQKKPAQTRTKTFIHRPAC